MSNDFYEADEPIEEIEATVGQGEEVVTIRARDLNQHAASIVNRATEQASAREVDVIVVDTTGWFAPKNAPHQANQNQSATPTVTDESLAHA